jgi:hypothetical protein
MPTTRLYTAKSQVIELGTQVAYRKQQHINFHVEGGKVTVNYAGGDLAVSHVEHVDRLQGFCGADDQFTLTLENGDKVDADDVVVTDGNYK